MKLLFIASMFLLLLGCSYTPPNYSSMLINEKRSDNTIQYNIGTSITNCGVNLAKPDQSNPANSADYPKKTFSQSILSIDYFINTRLLHIVPNISATNTSLGLGFDIKKRVLLMVTPGFHFTEGTIPTNTRFIDDRFINYHISTNLSSSKNSAIVVSNDMFKSQFLMTSWNHDFSFQKTPYLNKFALSLLFYDRLIYSAFEVSFLNSYDFNYYGGGLMFTFGFR